MIEHAYCVFVLKQWQRWSGHILV